MSVVAPCERHCLSESSLPVVADVARLEAIAKEVGPDELREGHGLLGITARISNGAGERSERIIDQLTNSLGNG